MTQEKAVSKKISSNKKGEIELEKTIVIDGQEVKFKSTAGTPTRYRQQFGKDLLGDVIKLGELAKINENDSKDLNSISEADFQTFYNLAWIFAKTADKEIPDPLTWMDQFDSFPILDILPDIQEMLMSCIGVRKA